MALRKEKFEESFMAVDRETGTVLKKGTEQEVDEFMAANPTLTLVPNAKREPGPVPVEKITRVTVNYVDSFVREGRQGIVDTFEGENVGINPGIVSTICLPLIVEQEQRGDYAKVRTVMLPHTFMREIIFEQLPKKD